MGLCAIRFRLLPVSVTRGRTLAKTPRSQSASSSLNLFLSSQRCYSKAISGFRLLFLLRILVLIINGFVCNLLPVVAGFFHAFLMIRRHPKSAHFPYSTLFLSKLAKVLLQGYFRFPVAVFIAHFGVVSQWVCVQFASGCCRFLSREGGLSQRRQGRKVRVVHSICF